MWSIGIYSGESAFHLGPISGLSNPVLTRSDVSDVTAAFVADPFMIQANGSWYMFFEVMNRVTQKGEIGLATSADGLAWQYQQIVLTEPFHLSYPYVFDWRGEHYMVPETLGLGNVSLYRAEDFPTRWSYVGPLLKGDYADPSLFHFDGHWWMFACSNPYENDRLCLYQAEELGGPWREHPASPIVAGNKHNARPAGRVIVTNGAPIRFSQDCVPIYGTQVRAFEITEISSQSYVEIENKHSPVLTAGGDRWNSLRMHHVDSHLLPDGQWIACVDGFGEASE